MNEKRKKKLINKRFQLVISFKIIILSLIPLALVLTSLIYIKINAEEKLYRELESLNEAVQTEDNIIQAYLEIARVYKDKDIRLAAQNVKTDHEKSIKIINDYIDSLKTRIGYLRYIIVFLSALAIVHALFFFRYIIRLTHRIAGPVVRMREIIKALLENKKADGRKLREKDEFRDVYNDLIRLTDKINIPVKEIDMPGRWRY